MDRFYSPSGVLRQGVYNPSAGSKQFEIATPALARWYLTQFNSGITRIQMFLEGARERDSHNGGHIVEVTRCTFIYYFTNETQVCPRDPYRLVLHSNWSVAGESRRPESAFRYAQ